MHFQHSQPANNISQLLWPAKHLIRNACLCVLVCVTAISLAGCDDPVQAEPEQAQTETDPTDSTSNAKDGQPDAARPPIRNPFTRRTPAPQFDEGLEWINTGGPIDLKDLRGKFVLLDFWTYCCINCLHILPELKKLEHAYPNEVVVIGVHSAKFETEKESENIRQAVLRYEIEHPVVNDAEMTIWRRFGITGWPALRVIDPQGNIVAGHGGEVDFESLNQFMKMAIPFYKANGLLDETPVRFELERDQEPPTPLRYPGKLLVDQTSDRLFIADTGHNRIVVTNLAGKLIETIGTGQVGRKDGAYDQAMFDHPHGIALRGTTLYVADTQNHLIRKIDLEAKQVNTIAGTGKQNRGLWPGMDRIDPTGVDESAFPDRWASDPKKFPLSSPWALAIQGEHLYIAMAGPHQIWRMTLDEKWIEVYAGNGREDIIDGQLAPSTPPRLDRSGYDDSYSTFAQPSGLAADDDWLYVADTEGSSIRAVPFDPEQTVKTVVGTSELPGSRLFIFGDRDGRGLLKPRGSPLQFRLQPAAEETAGPLLQHATGIAYADGKLFVADTYNDKIKRIDLKDGSCTTIAGKPDADGKSVFDEPAGLAIHGVRLLVADTNNHQIRIVDLQDNAVAALEIEGLEPPAPPEKKSVAFNDAVRVAVPEVTARPVDGKVDVALELKLPAGWKINPLGPMRYQVRATGESGPVNRATTGKPVALQQAERSASLTIPIPLSTQTGRDDVELYLTYFYCREGAEGFCKVGSVVWEFPLNVSPDANPGSIELDYTVP